jgi:hypothetical protein
MVRTGGGGRRTKSKTCLSTNLPTTNTTRNDPGAIPGLRGERPATNPLKHFTVYAVDDRSLNNPVTSRLLSRSPLTKDCNIWSKISGEVFSFRDPTTCLMRHSLHNSIL